jgi:addiction module RelE/StbE family toxin
MNVSYEKTFDEQFSRLSNEQKRHVRDAIELFIGDPMHPSLRNHPLKNEWERYRSITADTDIRLHYRFLKKDGALFVAVGSHDQLYK